MALASLGCAGPDSLPPSQPTTSEASTGSDARESTTAPERMSTTGSADDSTGSSDDGVTFIVQPEDIPPAFGCDIWAEDCPPGMKCAPWATNGGSAWNGTRCVTIPPEPALVGEPCTIEGDSGDGIDDCELHSVCFGVDPVTNTGTCVGWCTGSSADPSCADRNESCAASSGAFAFCFANCSPLEADCANGWGCYPNAAGFLCTPLAHTAARPGQACRYVNACAPGHACMNPDYVGACAGGAGCCSAFCEVDAMPTPCLEGQVCVPWDNEPDPEHPSLGICALPQN